MGDDVTTGTVSKDRRSAPPFRSLLVPIDLTPGSDRVLGRLSLLPLADDLRVTLLHVIPPSLSPREQENAERDASKALATEARHVSRSLPKGAFIEPVVKSGTPAKVIGAYASKVKAELIVMGRCRRRSLRDAFLGSTAERVLRQARVPVLVVRLAAREAYRRPALALDHDEAAHEVVRVVLRVLSPPRPRLTVIHAFDEPYHGMIYPSLSEEAEERKQELQLKASRKLASLFAKALERANSTSTEAPSEPHVRYGTPRLLIEKVVKKTDTDLLALGTRAYSGAAYVFLGTVAGDVLRQVRCDVLVVPPVPSRQ